MEQFWIECQAVR